MKRLLTMSVVVAVAAAILVVGAVVAQGEPRLVRVRDDGATNTYESIDGLPGCWQIGRYVYQVEGTNCTSTTTTTTTVAPTTSTSTTTTTVASTTTTSTVAPSAGTWTSVAAGPNREPEFAPSSSPGSGGVCFFRNGAFNRCDATPNPYQMYPPMTLINGDVLRAEKTDGTALSTYVVGGGASTTTVAPTTTAPPIATTTVAPTTTTSGPPQTAGFVETFDGNTGLDRFRHGVYHRDNAIVSQTQWPGDHDLNCGDPSTQRTIHRDNPAESFYLCRDHLMTSVGDTSGYSIAWFSPDQTFSRGDVTSVSWDVNSTDLGGRQWWEVMLVAPDGPDLTCISYLPCGDIAGYPAGAVVVDSQPRLTVNGSTNDLTWQRRCGSFAIDPEGCGSKAIRRTWTMTDNLNGTITVEFMGQAWTRSGSFPTEFKVVFKDHNYTPDKDQCGYLYRPCPGYTWHWDSIVVD